MDFEFKIGQEESYTMLVEKKHMASEFAKNAPDVFASPFMFALMETAALNLVAKYLPDGLSTVGIELKAKHLAPTPLGFTVKAVAKLVKVDRKALYFDVEAYDDKEIIGKGEHIRYIIDSKKFYEKIENKAKSE